MEEEQSLLKSTLNDLHVQFQEIKKFKKIDNFQENDTESVNLSSQMKSLIDGMYAKIENIIYENDHSPNLCCTKLSLRLLAMKTTLLYEKSKLLVNLGNEKLAEELLFKAFNDIIKDIAKPHIVFLAFRIINHYSYLLTKREDFEKARELLELAETIYKELKKTNPVIVFYSSDDLFFPDINALHSIDSNNKLERLVTNNLQMLGFIYNKQELHDKFAEYHHEVLERQIVIRDGNATMWAVKCARLASYFLTKNRFREARHHLAAAMSVLYSYEKELKKMEPSNNTIVSWQELQQKLADIAKYWVKYGLFLFGASKTNIVSHFCGDSNQALEKVWAVPFKFNDLNKPSTLRETYFKNAYLNEIASSGMRLGTIHRNLEDSANEKLKSTSCTENETSHTSPDLTEDAVEPEKIIIENYQGPLLFFKQLNLSKYEDQVAVNTIETTAQARSLFLYTHSWLKKAKDFYTLREHPVEYVNAILDLSELYRYLAFYEEDIESQYAVQKLRADALETLSAVLREVRPQCYIAVSVELLRELAEVQLEMTGLNLRRIYIAQDASPDSSEAAVHKMEALADIHSKLEHFGDTLGGNEDTADLGSIPISDMVEDACQYFNV
ncbi:KIF1-binding protein homolog [Orussus abietinus]|uniref:KIF1-binding protein homolog n=1 Tax=Orussus abietinus TaxID=222816 RepID=UPI000624F808|nr:KIF1-binding protein homolog [Orussus abietinus]